MSRWGITNTDQAILDWLLTTDVRVGKNANKRGVRAALNVLRLASAQRGAQLLPSAGPLAQRLGSKRGFFLKVDATAAGTVQGVIGSKRPGSLVETGTRAHWSLMRPDIVSWALRHGREDLVRPAVVRVTRNGRSHYVNLAANPVLRDWLLAHKAVIGPDGYYRFFHSHDMGPRPVVVPAAQSAETAALEAYADILYAAMVADR